MFTSVDICQMIIAQEVVQKNDTNFCYLSFSKHSSKFNYSIITDINLPEPKPLPFRFLAFSFSFINPSSNKQD